MSSLCNVNSVHKELCHIRHSDFDFHHLCLLRAVFDTVFELERRITGTRNWHAESTAYGRCFAKRLSETRSH